MRILVTWGSKMGGTEGIAQIIAEQLRCADYEVIEKPAGEVGNLASLAVDAVIVGGALYGNCWHGDAGRFVKQNLHHLRRLPVWFFSSGPLDDSAEKMTIPPTTQVSVLMERVGAIGHTTFGGRLPADARGFPAGAMAAQNSGDWRDREQIVHWAQALARELPAAQPRVAIDHPAGSSLRLIAYGVCGWVLITAVLYGLHALFSSGTVSVLQAILAPLVFILVARSYFHARGARDPLPAGLGFTAIVVLLNAVIIAGLWEQSFAMLASITAMWLPVTLIFAATWTTGRIMATMPWTAPPKPAEIPSQ